jgi:hypothetical protein
MYVEAYVIGIRAMQASALREQVSRRRSFGRSYALVPRDLHTTQFVTAPQAIPFADRMRCKAIFVIVLNGRLGAIGFTL